MTSEGSRAWLLLAGLMLLAVGCATTERTDYGTESHWLDACEVDDDCGGGDLRCVCGSCTHDCKSDNACGARRDAICVNAESPLLLRRCETQHLPASDGVCIARCEGDEGCSAGTGCVSGACVPLLSTPDATVATMPDAMVATTPDAAVAAQPDAGDPLRDRIDDLAPIDASVSFDEPIEVPKPEIAIQGADEQLIGTWKQIDCHFDNALCARFEIQRNEGGAVVGTVTFEPPPGPGMRGWELTPLDPDRGYPVGPPALDYETLRQVATWGVPYRMLNGRWDGTRLRFAWSSVDLWLDWCALQTPHPWTLGNRTMYLCVPQGPEELAKVDPSKALLCQHHSAAAGAPPCLEGPGLCVCDPSLATDCPYPFCRCDAQACEADVNLYQTGVDLTLEGGRLVGAFRSQASALANDAKFERVSP